MKRLSRTKASVINSSVATIAQAIQLIAQFIARSVFIHTLGSEYLGLNGLFLNILGYLSFAELGIGSAITFSLYKPLNEHNDDQISAILKLFRRLYRYIAIIVLVAGILVTPIVPRLIGGNTTGIAVDIRVAFLLALLNTVLSYFTTYKRTLLIADQRGYINTINTVGFNVAGQLLQIIQLLIWQNFYVYLLVQAGMMLASNLRVAHVVNRLYPNISIKDASRVDKSVVDYLKKNITGMISSKIGGILVTGTDNLLLSYYIGLVAVGMYSNYVMIVNGLTMLINQLVSAVSASVGNLGASNASRKHQEKIFYQYFMVTSLICMIMVVGFAGFSSAFVKIWVSKKMVYSFLPQTIIAINFFLQGLRQSIINYTNAYGLYWYERWKTIFEASVNFIISWWLVKYTSLSVSGILLGTICSNLLVNYLWESHIVLKFGLRVPEFRFLRLYAGMIITGSIVIISTTTAVHYLGGTSLFWGIGISIIAEILALLSFIIVNYLLYPKEIEQFNLVKIIQNILSRFKG